MNIKLNIILIISVITIIIIKMITVMMIKMTIMVMVMMLKMMMPVISGFVRHQETWKSLNLAFFF